MNTTANESTHIAGRRRLGHGASRWVRRKIGDCAIVATTAIVLTAESLVLAAPATATEPHGTHGLANHIAPSAIPKLDKSSGASSHRQRPHGAPQVGNAATDRSVGEPAAAAGRHSAKLEASDVWLPGRDKCKRRRGLRALPLWCADPAAGWIGSTTHRAQNDPGNPMGICDAGSLHPASGCRPAHTATDVT
jgi:hypothetical protein